MVAAPIQGVRWVGSPYPRRLGNSAGRIAINKWNSPDDAAASHDRALMRGPLTRWRFVAYCLSPDHGFPAASLRQARQVQRILKLPDQVAAEAGGVGAVDDAVVE